MVYCVRHALYIAINLKVAAVRLQRIPRAHFLLLDGSHLLSMVNGRKEGEEKGKRYFSVGEIWPWSPGFGGAPVM